MNLTVTTIAKSLADYLAPLFLRLCIPAFRWLQQPALALKKRGGSIHCM